MKLILPDFSVVSGANVSTDAYSTYMTDSPGTSATAFFLDALQGKLNVGVQTVSDDVTLTRGTCAATSQCRTSSFFDSFLLDFIMTARGVCQKGTDNGKEVKCNLKPRSWMIKAYEIRINVFLL